ncbi:MULTISPECIES: CheW domain-containing protein [Pseudomonas]|uniref:CheW domain-containing protein n=1 Tax=Pseudomonas pergaminensis TaxID=2853159 RepID=A0ABD7TDS9_9PSED|nr:MULTISPECIES: CheW domain-containing protein [Pseudomonas]AQT95670.1 chemotaxis protein CheW [Pseudomonas azotoformans]MBT1263242.1 CheW domain-containing protein [Pseudomonas sp. VS40]MBT1275173.1 CheW domain-containing protein [Pseudomonas sp. VS59]PJK37274.1 chemotaxis protein CheW [Pseudomonas sp. S09F 262]PJK41222.1 chemotaxis protein CheW [Pseudomonas sp. S10E 269]
MNRPVELKTRPQLALESYLDALLQDATAEELPEPILVLEPAVEPESTLDEFQLAVLEEQARDAQVVPVAPVIVPIAPAVVAPVVVEPVVEVHLPPSITPPPVTGDGRPSWAAEPFECLLFDVAGLTLAVPLVCLGSIYSLEGQELTPLFGQPEWFLGILPSQAGNLKVLDTARWVMPDRYRDDFRQGLQYVISVQGYEWGLAVHQVSRSLRLDPNEIKWRSHRGQRPWLAGTVIEHMCALLDVAELAELIASGAVKAMPQNKRS